MQKPIRLEVIENKDQHFVVYFDKPGRIEVSLGANKKGQRPIIAHVYKNTAVDMNQDPEFMYDGFLADEMESVGLGRKNGS